MQCALHDITMKQKCHHVKKPFSLAAPKVVKMTYGAESDAIVVQLLSTKLNIDMS